MRGAERSAGNTAKNIALIVLAALMAVLCAANWLAGVSAASLGSDNPLRRVHDRLFGGATGYEIRSSGVSAASPAQLALGASGELVGVQYSTTDVDASLGAVRSIWTQALSGDALMETDEQTLAGELGAERKVLLRYHGALPLSVVSGWMGGTLADDRIKVETLFYSADSGTLFVRTPDGEGTVLEANVVAGTLKVRSNVESLAPKIYKRSECTYLRGGRRAPVEPDPDHT